jgi:hypothetical protein
VETVVVFAAKVKPKRAKNDSKNNNFFITKKHNKIKKEIIIMNLLSISKINVIVIQLVYELKYYAIY